MPLPRVKWTILLADFTSAIEILVRAQTSKTSVHPFFDTTAWIQYNALDRFCIIIEQHNDANSTPVYMKNYLTNLS